MRNKLEITDLWEKFRDAAQPVFEELCNELAITCIPCYSVLPDNYRDKLAWELKV